MIVPIALVFTFLLVSLSANADSRPASGELPSRSVTAGIEAPGGVERGDIGVSHHPPGDLAGSYVLNSSVQSGYWLAAVFTGLVIVAFLASLILIKPGKLK